MSRPWSATELATLRLRAGEGTAAIDIAKELGRTLHGVYGKACASKIRLPGNREHAISAAGDIEVWAWVKAKRELGSYKSFAKKLGVSLTALTNSIQRMERAERYRQRAVMEAAKKPAKRSSTRQFYKDLERLPY